MLISASGANHRLRRRFLSRPERRDANSVGLEHEFIVHRSGKQVDFRDLIHRLRVPGRRVDPGDPHAYRTRSGLMLTCDGPEAEIATPPIALSRGFAEELDAWAEAGAQLLINLLPRDLTVEGCSTHLSVSIDERLNTSVCRLFARTFSPALMLLMDSTDSPGLLIRPRHGRVELGAEYVSGAPLRAATTLAVGGVRACVDFYRRRPDRTELPARLEVRVAAANDRFGWFVDRNAFGIDLYAGGRSSQLITAGGGVISAQQQLEDAWTVALAFLHDDVEPNDVAVASRLVRGRDPLPVEVGRPRKPGVIHQAMVSEHGAALEPILRPHFSTEAAIATWDVTIFRITGHRSAYAAVPRRYLSSFLPALQAGRLDDPIEAYLAAPPTGRTLGSHRRAVSGPALYDEIGWTPALLAPERDWDGVPHPQVAAGPSGGPGESVPASGVKSPTDSVVGERATRRFGKGMGRPLTQPPTSEPPRPPRRLPPVSWLLGVGAALLIAVIAFVALNSGDGTPAAGPSTRTEATTGADTATEPTTGPGAATQPTTASDTATQSTARTGTTTSSTGAATTTSTIVESTGAALPFDAEECQLSEVSGISAIDCPPKLALSTLTGHSPSAGDLALKATTETGLLASDAPNSSISLRMFTPGGDLSECFVRGTGEAVCRGFSANFQEIQVPAGAGPPGWDAATDTFTLDGLVWDGNLLTWHETEIASVDLFLRSREDPNRTNTIRLDRAAIGSILNATS